MTKSEFARVLLKVMGVYFFIPSLIRFFGQIPEYSRISSKILSGEWDANPMLSYMIQSFLLMVFGLLLIVQTDFFIKHVLRLKDPTS